MLNEIYYYIPIRLAKIQNYDSTICWQDYRESGTFIGCLWEFYSVREREIQPLVETNSAIVKLEIISLTT